MQTKDNIVYWEDHNKTMTCLDYKCQHCFKRYDVAFYAHQARIKCPSCKKMTSVTVEYIIFNSDVADEAYRDSD